MSPAHHVRIVIVSGLSGSGKSTAVRALEDIGFFCIDNLPVPLIEPMLELSQRAGIHDIAVVVDVRERHFLADYERAVLDIRAAGYTLSALYLSCSDDALIRRFKETRRRHPLQGDGSIEDGVHAERDLLDPIHQSATHVFDTSDDTVHGLRRRVQDAFRTAEAEPMLVRIESFGFKHGVPREADYLFDVRFLSNPFFVPGLREQRGIDSAVSEYVFRQPDTAELVEHVVKLLGFVLPRFERDGRSQVTVAIGCTGGRHRSVAITERVSELLRAGGTAISVEHRDLNRE